MFEMLKRCFKYNNDNILSNLFQNIYPKKQIWMKIKVQKSFVILYFSLEFTFETRQSYATEKLAVVNLQTVYHVLPRRLQLTDELQ